MNKYINFIIYWLWIKMEKINALTKATFKVNVKKYEHIATQKVNLHYNVPKHNYLFKWYPYNTYVNVLKSKIKNYIKF